MAYYTPEQKELLRKKYRFYNLKCWWWNLQRQLFHPNVLIIGCFFCFLSFLIALGTWLESVR